MKEQDTEILDAALNELANTTGIKIKIDHYLHKNPDYDATASLPIGDDEIPLAIQLTVRPTLAMLMLTRLNQTNELTLIVANYVNPIMAERLKVQNIWFLDSAGNAYIKHPQLFVYIKGNKPTEKPTPPSRAFYSSGLKVVYAYLCNPELVNAPYRCCAETADVALGTVGWIINDLTKLGHIVDMGSRGRRLKGKRKLLERWIISYPEKLRPKLELGKYKALNPDWWQTIQLTPFQACWGSEVAAEEHAHQDKLFSHLLLPLILTWTYHRTNNITTNPYRKNRLAISNITSLPKINA